MPKFPKAFGRRKSSGGGLEITADEPAGDQHSFKVFERPDGGSKSFGGGVRFANVPTNGQFGRPNTSHIEGDNMFEHLGKNRGSGASNTNTASTTDNSSRLSAASTAPSSTDVSGREDGRSYDKKYGDIPLPPVPKTSGFSLKNASRTLSFGRTKNSELPALPVEASPPLPEEQPSGRARAVTASSYASTATPPKLDERDLGLSLGGDFSDMFAGFGKRKSQVLDAMDNKKISRSPEMLPSEISSRPSPSNRLNQPTPLHLDKNRDVEPSPYSWSSQNSADGLMSNSTPPPIPQHNSPTTNRLPQRPGGITETGLRRSSGLSGRRQSTLEQSDDLVDEDARLLRESLSASRRLNEPANGPRAHDSWLNPLAAAGQAEASGNSNWRTGSVETTPRAKRMDHANDELFFDNHIAESASTAQKFQDRPPSPPNLQEPQNKVMTPAQFERYKQDKERLKSIGGLSKTDDDEDEEPETYDDDEDEAEKAREAAKQRRKQEAHMSVYRQQMMKVTGETSSFTGPSRASLFATQSSPNLGKSEENEEEDEEIPLAILQAHGFPNKAKQPIPRIGSNPSLRASVLSTAGGVVDPRLPAFARNLPEDPYVGAGLVNSIQRESMAFGGGAGSVHGGSSRGLPPGGLVGVIATEERSRAMRRGSPNPQGEYAAARQAAGGMGNGMMPGPMGPMNPMMLTPGDQAQIQMSQQMSQFMQMQMQFMQMMTSGQGGQGQMPQQSLSIPTSDGQGLRPPSAHLHQRSMTMMEPNAAPWMQQMQAGSVFAPSIHTPGAGYTPSIAPSERSNVGLPGRYRPVSHMPVADTKSRTSTMSGALQGWDKHQSVTTKPVKKFENASDEDDDEGWEEMAKKREKKKSKWRMKKDSNGLKEMLGYTQ